MPARTGRVSRSMARASRNSPFSRPTPSSIRRSTGPPARQTCFYSAACTSDGVRDGVRSPAFISREVLWLNPAASCSSPKVRISTPSTVRRCDRSRRLPSFAAVAGAADVFAGSSIRGDLQAPLAVARVAEQPPASTTPVSLLDGTSSSSSPPPTSTDYSIRERAAVSPPSRRGSYRKNPATPARSLAATGIAPVADCRAASEGVQSPGDA